jgi:UDP-glucose:(heptosyl)LPS alpha-1,3-glucosyltransferase
MHRQLEQAFKLSTKHLRDVFSGVTVPMLSHCERAAIRERLRRDLGMDPQTPWAIFVGHNFRRKGLARLLEALALPEASQWHLLVVGKDKVEPVRRLARKVRVLERVKFLGHRTDVWELYCAADVCVLPTYYDPGSRTVLEALSLGVPSITTMYDGSADCIRDGEHGFVLKSPEAIQTLAHALQQLIPVSARQRMSENALQLRDYLSMRRHAEEIAALYEEIARKGSARSALQQLR